MNIVGDYIFNSLGFTGFTIVDPYKYNFEQLTAILDKLQQLYTTVATFIAEINAVGNWYGQLPRCSTIQPVVTIVIPGGGTYQLGNNPATTAADMPAGMPMPMPMPAGMSMPAGMPMPIPAGMPAGMPAGVPVIACAIENGQKVLSIVQLASGSFANVMAGATKEPSAVPCAVPLSIKRADDQLTSLNGLFNSVKSRLCTGRPVKPNTITQVIGNLNRDHADSRCKQLKREFIQWLRSAQPDGNAGAMLYSGYDLPRDVANFNLLAKQFISA